MTRIDHIALLLFLLCGMIVGWNARRVRKQEPHLKDWQSGLVISVAIVAFGVLVFKC